MSCTALGFDDEYGWRVARSSDASVIITATPSGSDFTGFAGFSGTFAVRAALDSASAELTVGTTATANGSVMVFSENTIALTLKAADLQELPQNSGDEAEPWDGWFEWLVTGTDGLTSRLYQLPFIVERGAAE